MAYSSSDFDTLQPADRLKIEHSIYIREENADISQLTPLPMEQLQTMREQSAAAEQAIFDNLREAAREWEVQAAQTLQLDKAIEYVRTPPVRHTANEWIAHESNRDRQIKSNMVYSMSHYVYERTKYDREAQKSVTVAYELSWDVFTNSPQGNTRAKIAGQDRKVYSEKADMEKYLAGRIKAYSHLFTEISPPIPQEHAKHFSVNGQLLPGYTIEGEEPKQHEIPAIPSRPEQPQQTDPAADIGGDSISTENELRKELDTMKEPLNIQLTTRELQEAGESGIWLQLPATADQLNAALARIGAQGGEQGKDYFINGIETPIPAIERIPLENVQNAGINDLNYLAARLEALDDKQIAKLSVVATLTPDWDSIPHIAEQAHNANFYEHYPEIMTHAQLGEHVFEKSGLIQIPEYWVGAVDREKLGQLAAEHELGIFTEQGYVVESGAEWESLIEIPQEYQIAPKHERPEREPEQPDAPPVEHDATAPGAATAEPPAQAKALATAAPFVLVSDNPKDKLTEITGKLESGVKGIFESEQYKKCLDTFSKFHNYSVNNCLLIAMQMPDATHVAGFNAWKNDFKRPVMKGEKGIKIFAPAPFKAKKTVDKLDASGKPVIGKDGKREKEEQEVTIPAFKVTTVFDVSQTDGEPLPELGVSELVGSVDKYKEFFAALEKASPVPISFEPISTGAKAYYHQMEKRITINEGMSELQNLKSAIHEMAHARLHAIDTESPLRGQSLPDKHTREVEAESIAYTVCQHYGLDTSDYSFGYVAGWSGGKELDTLKSSLDTIRKEAGAIIAEVDKHFAELTQDKEQAAELPAPGQQPSKNLQEAKQGLESEVKATMQFLVDSDIKKHGEVQPGTLETLAVQGYEYRDGKLEQLAPEATTPAPTIDLKAVADYMQKQNDTIQAADPSKAQGQAAFNMAIKRLEKANERIPAEHPQLKALITNAAQSPDLPTLKERMNTLHTEFTQHYSTAVQNTIDTSGKAEPPAPAASVRQTDTPPVKPPAQGENVAAIEAKVKAGEVINLTDLSDAMKKDKQVAQSAQGKATQQAPTKSAKRTTAKKQDWKGAQKQDAWDRAQGKAAAKPAPEKPSIKDKIAAGRREIEGQKSSQQKTATKNKNAGLGE